MDWKILVAVVVGLLIFGIYQLCSSGDEKSYDDVQAELRAAREDRHADLEAEKAVEQREEKIEKAREQRGERPEERTVTLRTDDFRAVLTSRGGALRSLQLLDPQYLEPPRDWSSGQRLEDAPEEEYVPVDLVTTNPKYEINDPLRFEAYQGLEGLLPDADYELLRSDEKTAVFRYRQPDLPVVITKKFTVGEEVGPYQVWLSIRVRNTGEKKVSFMPAVVQTGFQHATETGGGLFSRQPNLLQGLCRHGGSTYREPWNSGEAERTYSGIGVSFTGVETNYFLAAMIPGGDDPTSCSVRADVWRTPGGEPRYGLVRAELRWGEIEIGPGESHGFEVKNYLGPKKYSLLQTVGHDLKESVDFGWFWPISRVLLSLLLMFQKLVLNWGVAIILLTVMVKLALLPLTHKSFQSAEKMRALKPQVDEINKKYKDDAQKKQQETMALYKRNKVNPLGGCLPTLLQMPIWFALYRTLRAAPELYRAEFFGWIDDLSSPDPYFVTPIVMGAMMFIQQQFMPTTGDSTQAKIMKYFMPIMFTGMMLFLPSGLTLYILVNTALSILHQLIIHRRRKSSGSAPPPAKAEA
jgi:YidC/Oxa1 family membrane protein insertase